MVPRQAARTPAVNEAELALLIDNEKLVATHAHLPWAKLVSSKSVWLLWAQYFCLTYPWYFYITWLPQFLRTRYPYLSDDQRASLAFVPLLRWARFPGLRPTCPVHGPLDRSVNRARRTMAMTGFFGAAVMLCVCIQVKSPLATIAALGLASFCNDLVMPGAWATCMDIGGKFAGTVSGSMNMWETSAGFVAPVAGGYILQATGGR